MRLSNKKFKTIIGDEFEKQLDKAGPFPGFEVKKKRKKRDFWLNCSAVIIVCLLFSALFFNSDYLSKERDINETELVAFLTQFELSQF